MLNQGICFFLHSSSSISLGTVLCLGKIWNNYGNTSPNIVTIMIHLSPSHFLYSPLPVNREDKDTPKGFEFAWCGFLFWARSVFLFLFLPRVRNKNSHYSEIRLPVAFLFLYYPFSTRSLGWTMVVNLELKRDSGVSHRLLKESPSLLYKSRGGCCNGT